MDTLHANNEKIGQLNHELEDLHKKLVEADKFASIGRLTAGILHEIKNPLNFVNNFAKISHELLDELKEHIHNSQDKFDKDTREDMDDVVKMLGENMTKILENGERAQRITATMLAQTRERKETVFEPTDVNQLVDEFAKLAYHGVRGTDKEFNIKIKTDYDKRIGNVNIGKQEMSRVIINIVNNACYALNEKKKKLGNEFSPGLFLQTKKYDNEIEILIHDNGIGIPQKVIDKLFTPFFTTKPKGQGTGLGLSLSREIIKDIHKGSIDIRTKEGEYTEFIIKIPCSL